MYYIMNSAGLCFDNVWAFVSRLMTALCLFSVLCLPSRKRAREDRYSTLILSPEAVLKGLQLFTPLLFDSGLPGVTK